MVTIRVLSLNVFLRPTGIQCPMGDYKSTRLAFLKQKILAYDVVLLQEMFVAGSTRQSKLLKFASEHGFLFHAGSVYPRFWSRKLIDGGLLILSRYPIVAHAQHIFSVGRGSDGVCAKGVVYAQLQLAPGNPASKLNVFTTHVQSGEDAKATSIRWHQIDELTTFIHHNCHLEQGIPILVGGDFNLDARHEAIFDGRLKKDVLRRCTESPCYQKLVTRLELAAVSRVINVFSNHDVTFGYSHGQLRQHLLNTTQCEATGKCIDYLFVLEPSNRETAINSIHILQAEVNQCALQDILPPPAKYAYRAPSITHLSDHWALHAVLEVVFDRSQQFTLTNAVTKIKMYPRPMFWMVKYPCCVLAILSLVGTVAAVMVTIMLV